MKKFSLDVFYEIGEEIELNDRKIKVIGYEFVAERGIRYIVLWHDGTMKWEYFYKFELDAMK
jgi:hypothetical protein